MGTPRGPGRNGGGQNRRYTESGGCRLHPASQRNVGRRRNFLVAGPDSTGRAGTEAGVRSSQSKTRDASSRCLISPSACSIATSVARAENAERGILRIDSVEDNEVETQLSWMVRLKNGSCVCLRLVRRQQDLSWHPSSGDVPHLQRRSLSGDMPLVTQSAPLRPLPVRHRRLRAVGGAHLSLSGPRPREPERPKQPLRSEDTRRYSFVSYTKKRVYIEKIQRSVRSYWSHRKSAVTGSVPILESGSAAVGSASCLTGAIFSKFKTPMVR